MGYLTANRKSTRHHVQFASAMALAVTLCAGSTADAAYGLYAQLGLGFGKFGGNQIVTEQNDAAGNDIPLAPGSEGCCPKGGLSFQLRTGYVLFGFVAPEFGLLANAFDLGSDTGGGGFVGGGLRLFPLGLFEVMDLGVGDFPLDFSIGTMFAYSVIGKDFAYQGSAFVIDAVAEYKVSEIFYIGVKFDVGLPSYSNFVFTDFNGSRGRCLDDTGDHVTSIADGSPTGREVPIHAKGDLECTGKGPGASFISTQLVVSFHLDLFNEGG